MTVSSLVANRSRSKRRVPAVDRIPQVYGYCRVSTDQQVDEGVSLEEQQRRIKGRADEMGWQLTKIFVEAGVSGSVLFAERPAGGELMGLLQPGDVVISPKLDRCFRSSLDALQTIEELKRRRVSLWLLDLGGDVSGNGISEMMLTILSAVAQFERVRIGERIRDAKRHMKSQGLHPGGKHPSWGFMTEPVPGSKSLRLVEDPAKQRAVRQILKLRADGLSLRAIAAAVEEAHGYRLSPDTVRQTILRNQPG